MAEERPPLLLTDDIRELLHLVRDNDLAEVLIERGDARVHVKRAVPPPPIVNMVAAAPTPVYSMPTGSGQSVAAPLTSAAVEPVAPVVTHVPVTAPMVGTFYGSPSPKDPPYVRVGDEVRPGDALGIIEAMKIMNEIECELHGRVVEVLVSNGQPVEYGQTLWLIDPIS